MHAKAAMYHKVGINCDQIWENPAYLIFHENRYCTLVPFYDLWTNCRSNLKVITRFIYEIWRDLSAHAWNIEFEKLRSKRVAMCTNDASTGPCTNHIHTHCAPCRISDYITITWLAGRSNALINWMPHYPPLEGYLGIPGGFDQNFLPGEGG